jgi:hypothetical protein
MWRWLSSKQAIKILALGRHLLQSPIKCRCRFLMAPALGVKLERALNHLRNGALFSLRQMVGEGAGAG